MTPEEMDHILRRKAAQLMEHFDTVRIFVTKHDGLTQETIAMDRGGGSFYAQRGQIQEWMNQDEEDDRAEARTHWEE